MPAAVVPFRSRPMHVRPEKGQRLSVLMKNGALLQDCTATLVWEGERSGIVIYHKRKAVDEALAAGWWPAA